MTVLLVGLSDSVERALVVRKSALVVRQFAKVQSNMHIAMQCMPCTLSSLLEASQQSSQVPPAGSVNKASAVQASDEGRCSLTCNCCQVRHRQF